MYKTALIITHKALALVVCACLALMGVPLVTVAEAFGDVATGELSCSNGWVLNYEASDGSATVTSVKTVGNGELVIPASAGSGNSVTSIGACALSAASVPGNANTDLAGIAERLTSVKLPDTVTTLGERAFYQDANLASCDVGDNLTYLSAQVFAMTGLTSIRLPKTVEGLNYQDFLSCKSLADVTFEGSTLGYIGRYVFSGCTALKRMEIPALVAYPPSEVGSQNSLYRINNGAFYDCSALKELVFKGGTHHQGYRYFESPAVLTGCNPDLKIIYFCGEDNGAGEGKGLRGVSYEMYYSVDFYASKADALAAKNCIASVTYPSEILITDIVNGTVDSSKAYSAERSKVPMDALSDGQVWALDETKVPVADPRDPGTPKRIIQSKLTGSMVAYPTNIEDLDHAFVTSKEIEALNGATTISFFGEEVDLNSAKSFYQIPRQGGIVDLSDIVVVAADGKTTIDPSMYVLSFALRVYDSSTRMYNFESVSARNVDTADTYRVIADGRRATPAEGTSTNALFNVQEFALAEQTCKASSAYGTAGATAFAASTLLERDEPQFTVVAPCSSWQLGLVALGLAGVGNSVAVFSDNGFAKSDSETSALQAIVRAGSASENGLARDNVFVLGTTSQVSSAYRNRLNEMRGSSDGMTSFSQSTPQDLSLAVYDTVKRYGKGGSSERYDYCWGDTAIVASPTKSYGVLPIGQLAYQAQAPVFFTQDNGSVSSKVLAALSDGGFKKIVIAGDENYVSASVEKKIASAVSGVTPTRMLAQSQQTSLACQELADAMIADYGASTGSIVAVRSDEPASVLAACELAAVKNGVVFPIASTADSKYLQRYLESKGCENMDAVTYIGAVSSVDSKLSARLKAIGTADALGTDVSKGDTFEHDGYVFKLTSSKKATYQGCFKVGDVASYTPLDVTLEGKAITATGYKNTAFDLEGVTSVTIPDTLASASAANLFQGCKRLKKVVVKATGSSFTLGKACFKGCTALTSVSLPAKLASVGANAFSGCTALKSLTLPGTALKKIGASAFAKCSKLKTLTIKSSKLKKGTVGAKAFSGMPSGATVKVPKAKVSAYKKIFVAKGLSKKAKVKKA